MVKLFKMLYDTNPFLLHYSAQADTLHSRGEQLLFTSPVFTMCMHALHSLVYMTTNE